MYSNTTLYYLNQLGIRPWVRRDFSVAKPLADSATLYVFTSARVDAKARLLLEQIVRFVDTEKQTIQVLSIDECTSSLIETLTRHPAIILLLGVTAEPFKNSGNTVIESIDLHQVMEHAVQKRKIFQDIVHINYLLNHPQQWNNT